MENLTTTENVSSTYFTKYQLLLFFLLTYLLSWWSAPLMNGQIIPYGPTFAAIVVLKITIGWQGLKELRHRITQRRTPFMWFIVGPAIIIGYHLVGIVCNLLLGAKIVSLPHISIGTLLELLLIGGLWEEPGWTGYLLPKMKERFANIPDGLLIASLMTGVFRSIWHLPLFLYGHIPWFEVLFNFSFQLIIAWVFYRSGKSVLAVMLFHLASNLMGTFTNPIFTGVDHVSYKAIFMIAATAFALVLIWKQKIVE